jgi:lipid-binding SYLF domain-containing protein
MHHLKPQKKTFISKRVISKQVLTKLSIASVVLAMSAAAPSVFAQEMDSAKNPKSYDQTDRSEPNNSGVPHPDATRHTNTSTRSADTPITEGYGTGLGTERQRTNVGDDNDNKRTTEQGEVKKLLSDAKNVVQKMKSDRDVADAVAKAKALYVIPYYGRGALIAGGQGGEGVLFTSKDGEHRNPAFYNLGAVSVGAQAGGEMGEIVMLLMTDKAVNSFKQENNFALNAEAGLTLINWSAQAQANVGQGDIVIWSNTEGAFAGGALSVSNIFVDDEANQAYYGKEVRASDILDGKVSKASNAGKAQ